MIIESITIENIRSYEHQEIEFPQGVSLFEGDIGSGKSTVLMAIEFALFGLGSEKAEALLAKRADTGSVILDFSVGDDKYSIKRTLQRKNKSVTQDGKKSWLRINGSELPLSVSELKQKVIEILKFNETTATTAESRIFRYAIFTPQEAMKEILGDKTKRKETIRKAFGIEDYSIAIEHAKELQKDLTLRIGILKDRTGNIPQLEKDVTDLKEKIQKDETQVEKSEKILKANKKIEEDIKNRIKEYRERKDKRKDLESEKKSLDLQINSLKNQIQNWIKEVENLTESSKNDFKKLEELMEIKKPDTDLSTTDIDNLITKYEKINNQWIVKKSKREEMNQEIEVIKESLGNKMQSNYQILNKELEKLEDEEKDLNLILNENSDKLNSNNNEKLEKETIYKRLKKELDELKKLGNICPTCSQKITESHHHSLNEDKNNELEKFNKEIQELKNKETQLREDGEKQKKDLENYKSSITEIKEIIPKVKMLNEKTSELGTLDTEISQITQEMNKEFKNNSMESLLKLKEEVTQYKNKEIQVRDIKQRHDVIDSRKKEIEDSTENAHQNINSNKLKIIEIENQLIKIGNVDSKISNSELELEESRSQITKEMTNIASLQQKIDDNNSLLEVKNSEIAKSIEWKNKYKKTSEIQEWLEKFFIPVMSKIENQVMHSTAYNFNEKYKELYNILVEDPTKESRIDEDFNPIVEQDGYEQEIGYLSGGEKTSVALAYRLTLNERIRKESVTTESSLLILDEPTDGFSKNQLNKIKILFEKLQTKQIILVSHERELESHVEHIFNVVKENGVSNITKKKADEF